MGTCPIVPGDHLELWNDHRPLLQDRFAEVSGEGPKGEGPSVPMDVRAENGKSEWRGRHALWAGVAEPVLRPQWKKQDSGKDHPSFLADSWSPGQVQLEVQKKWLTVAPP